MILAILNLYVKPVPPIKFGLNSHFGLGGNVIWRSSRQPSWLSEWNRFSSSESPCLPNASHQISIHITLREQMSFQDFQAGHHGSHLRYWNGKNLPILNLHVTPMPPTKFGLNLTYRSGADLVWRFQDGHHGGHLGYHTYSTCGLGGDVVWRFSRWTTWLLSLILEQNDFSNSKSPCGTNASHQVWAQSDLGFRSRCGLKIFKMVSQAAILDGRRERF